MNIIYEKKKPRHKDIDKIRYKNRCGLKHLKSEKHTEVQCFFRKCKKVTKT